METILRAVRRNVILGAVIRNAGATVGVILLVAVGVAYNSILGMSPDEQKKLLWTVQEYLPSIIFLALASLRFSGIPGSFPLGGLSVLFGLIG